MHKKTKRNDFFKKNKKEEEKNGTKVKTKYRKESSLKQA